MKIWKYELADTPTVVGIPKGARVLRVAAQQNGMEVSPHLWALVDPSADMELRSFEIVGTGHDAPQGDYLGTFDMGPLVLHVFETTVSD